ncbi:hypothetical protein PSTG_07332 [Puccinia striiformis f. sp. tritici PST-78]|uniref:Uncharacterized protein n=1 Tax=Puccinia striiformis f. sp. tritici PST-78 TaxID=1165861 RepID=A0A0L0VJE4_9BASI|nr:hypothetical protein PSTG_07332 [Puccinia striiformis f. sp. tritici PST-78]
MNAQIAWAAIDEGGPSHFETCPLVTPLQNPVYGCTAAHIPNLVSEGPFLLPPLPNSQRCGTALQKRNVLCPPRVPESYVAQPGMDPEPFAGSIHQQTSRKTTPNTMEAAQAQNIKPQNPEKIKPCCACPETKRLRDDCFLRFGPPDESKESTIKCAELIAAHRASSFPFTPTEALIVSGSPTTIDDDVKVPSTTISSLQNIQLPPSSDEKGVNALLFSPQKETPARNETKELTEIREINNPDVNTAKTQDGPGGFTATALVPSGQPLVRFLNNFVPFAPDGNHQALYGYTDSNRTTQSFV